MIRGIGTDLVKTSRVSASIDRWGDRFAQKILTDFEFSKFETSQNKINFLAKRFAAKEAVAKALGTGMRSGVHFSGIEIKHHRSGAPFVILYAGAQKRADEMGVQRSHLSISDDKGYAIAFAVFEGDEISTD